MSIEALIQSHTEALLANTEAVKLLTLSLAGRTPTSTKVEKFDKSGPTGKTPDKVIVDEISAKEVTEVVEALKTIEPADEPKEQVGVPYETVRALVLKLAPTQRDAIKALNVKHGIANLKVLLDKEDDFSTVNDQAKLEAVYADLQALEG
jgi:hypothetical protein